MPQGRKPARGRRQDGAQETLISCLDGLDLSGRVLIVADDSRAIVSAILERAPDCDVLTWCRRLPASGRARTEATAWPPAGPFDTAIIRLPSVRLEQEMVLHAAASRTRTGGEIIVFGSNTDGIKSHAARMRELLGPTTVLSAKRHARVLSAGKPEDVAGLCGQLADWRQVFPLEIAGHARDCVSYPGVFAHGRLDEGTAQLIASLPEVTGGTRVLDYGCGAGAIAAAIAQHCPDAEIDMLDTDVLALEAARENVPSGTTILGRDLGAAGPGYGFIISNPTLHAGTVEDHGVLQRLIADAPRHLTSDGVLLLVVQRRVPLERALKAKFARVDIISETGRFRVWRASAA